MVSPSLKKSYSDEFKRDAIRLLETSGQSVSEIERELGITHGLLRKWQRRFQVNTQTDTLELSDIEQVKKELRELKRELEITRMERDILKTYNGVIRLSDLYRSNLKVFAKTRDL